MRKMLDKKEIEKIIDEHGGGGEPEAYLKSASVNGNTLTLTNKDNTTVAFTPEEVEIDGRTIVENAQGKLETAIGGYSINNPPEDYVDNEDCIGYASSSEPLFSYAGDTAGLVTDMNLKQILPGPNRFSEGNLYTAIVKVNGEKVWEAQTNIAYNMAGPGSTEAILIGAATGPSRISINTPLTEQGNDKFRIKVYGSSTSAMTFEETDVVTFYLSGPGLIMYIPIDGRFVPIDGSTIQLDLQNRLSGFSGDYDDLSNKPNLATVATTGDYDDLTNKLVVSGISYGGEYWDTITINSNTYAIPDAVSGVNDGTNWTSLTIGSDTYGIGGGSAPSNMVTTDTAQTITGAKTFSNDIALSGNVGIIIPNSSYHGIYNKQGTGYDEAKITLSSASGGGSVNFAIVNGFSASNRAQVSLNATASAANLAPTSGTVDLGTSTNKWNNLYLSGSLTDGTDSASLADLVALIAYAKSQGWIQ